MTLTTTVFTGNIATKVALIRPQTLPWVNIPDENKCLNTSYTGDSKKRTQTSKIVYRNPSIWPTAVLWDKKCKQYVLARNPKIYNQHQRSSCVFPKWRGSRGQSYSRAYGHYKIPIRSEPHYSQAGGADAVGKNKNMRNKPWDQTWRRTTDLLESTWVL